jgi:hypothetical protein
MFDDDDESRKTAPFGDYQGASAKRRVAPMLSITSTLAEIGTAADTQRRIQVPRAS